MCPPVATDLICRVKSQYKASVVKRINEVKQQPDKALQLVSPPAAVDMVCRVKKQYEALPKRINELEQQHDTALQLLDPPLLT